MYCIDKVNGIHTHFDGRHSLVYSRFCCILFHVKPQASSENGNTLAFELEKAK
jgi:hypothetical protein